jgi:hypothetical protein
MQEDAARHFSDVSRSVEAARLGFPADGALRSGLRAGPASGRSVVSTEEEQRQHLPTCILGMHRSGTSVVSRLVNLLGVDLGPESALLASTADNPKGYWEHGGIVRINDEILERFGGRWDDVPSWPASWLRDSRLEKLRDRARLLVAGDFPRHGRWGWKDPRTCLTLPFWHEVVGRLQYVLAMRNPCAVIASLSRRDQMGHEQAESLWIHYVSVSLSHTAGKRRMFVFYDDLLRDLPRELQRLAAFLGVPAHAADPAVLAAVTDFVEASLCHHYASIEDIAADRRLSFVTKGLYLSLYSQASAPVDRDRSDSAFHACGMRSALDVLAAAAPDAWRRVLLVEKLARENDSRQTAIERLGSERDRLREEMTALRTQMAQLIAARDEQAAAREVAEQAHEASASRQAAAECAKNAADERLAAIETSTAWRVVSLVRHVLAHLAPAGTRRHGAWNAARRWIGSRMDGCEPGGVSGRR